MNDEQKQALHSRIFEFAAYSRVNIPHQIENIRVVLSSFPKDIRNGPLCHLLNTSVKGSFEALLNDVVQATDLVDKALRDFGNAKGLEPTKAIRNVQRMRNKLLAHRIEVLVSTNKHEMWYQANYGSYEKALTAIEKAAEELGDKAWELSRHCWFKPGEIRGVHTPLALKQDEILRLLSVMKSAGIY